jgi:uncharacterized membrane protein YphA (DoxX/SURF4 family)
MYTNRRKKNTPVVITLIRIVLALVFIASGFLKGVDPWGGAIKMNEYFTAFGMEWLAGARYVLAIVQSAFEMWLGFLLLFNQMRVFSRFFTMLFMIFFTGLTLITALTNPVSDCGCFGDAIKLTNWETFIKNAVLLPLSIVLFAHTRRENPAAPRWGAIAITLGMSLAPGLWAMRALPWIDFLPYKVGVNLPAQTTVPPELQGESKTTVIYRNRESGAEQEFEVSDTTWYDATRWEFVDTRTVVLSKGVPPPISGFAIFDGERDATAELLNEEEVFLLVADRLEEVTPAWAERFGRTARFAAAHGIRAVCLTTSSLDGVESFQRKIGAVLPGYNIDATTLKTMLRAHNGLVILRKGTIIAKKNLRQVPDLDQAGYDSGLEYVLDRERRTGERAAVVIYAILIIGLSFGSCKRHKD